ncbi:hypothetical protein [Rubrimonas cliftonensis]|uniref:Uncharacterized protein n=1 Tax=Rubrimonas cliftonensis TaxID=89524 RepID=A0A1H4CJB2_9RHOB|nr:hypothetical protein [Rubrimonas cliftonensis]SEA60152.1 hypothetical protein SAMN05444370_10790 [Rubrimonas cliftonensis]
MEDLLKLLAKLGVWGVFFGVCYGFARRYFHDLYKQPDKGRWIARLRHDGFARRYREMLAAALDQLDRRLSPEADPTPGAPKAEVSRAWSHGLLDKCPLLAVAYPILSVLIWWAATGEPGRIGDLTVIEAQHAVPGRLAAIGALALSAPVFLLWQVAALFGRPALDALLRLFEAFARGIGAV